MAEYGQVDLADVKQQLVNSPDDASVLVVGGPTNGNAAELWRADIVVGAESLVSEERLWPYESCTFAAAVLSASEVSKLLVAGSRQQLTIGPVTFEFSLQSFVSFRHKPRWAQHDERSYLWPSVQYDVSLTQEPSRPFQSPGQMLIGPGAPSFATFGAAFGAFFYENYVLTGSSNPTLGAMQVRVLDHRARISSVAIQPTHLEVEVDGSALVGSCVELMATSDRAMIPVTGPSRVDVPLPNGLPRDAWVWLRSNHDWLDYRSLSGWAAYRSPDVRDERPTEPSADLEAMIALGENQHVEFKQQLPDNSAGSRRTVFKTVTAFANGGGGSMLFGVSDDGDVVGVAEGKGDPTDRFFNMLRASTSPTSPCHAHEQVLNGRLILVVEVEPNSGAIYSLTVDSGKPEFFVRRGATTFHARADELESLVKRAVARQVDQSFPFS
jgi:hypothetical protein